MGKFGTSNMDAKPTHRVKEYTHDGPHASKNLEGRLDTDLTVVTHCALISVTPAEGHGHGLSSGPLCSEVRAS